MNGSKHRGPTDVKLTGIREIGTFGGLERSMPRVGNNYLVIGKAHLEVWPTITEVIYVDCLCRLGLDIRWSCRGVLWVWSRTSRDIVALLIKKDLHIFGEKQADINWDNEDVRKELYEVLRWWLERGVDGFRVWFVIRDFRDKPAAYSWNKLDCMNLISKTPNFPEAPESKKGSPFQPANLFFANGWVKAQGFNVSVEIFAHDIRLLSVLAPASTNIYKRCTKKSFQSMMWWQLARCLAASAPIRLLNTFRSTSRIQNWALSFNSIMWN